jgi:two-component system, cell cycle response regulator DivK
MSAAAPGPNQSLVLIVDDYADALEIYQSYLAFKGYRAITASSGAEALALARDERPAIIFMDIRMPNLTGTEAMHELRRDPSFHKVPIIALTAHALDDERAAALNAGFTEVLPKPCSPDALIDAIERLVPVN